jgi:uridine kinase
MKKHYKTHVKVAPEAGCGREPHVLLAGPLRRKFAGLVRPVLIAVGGPGGIGKTTFAKNLASELGAAVVLGLDNYKTPREVREQKKVYGPHPDANEMELLHRHLQQLRQGEAIKKPRYCRVRGRIQSTVTFAPDRFVLVEGEIATYREFHAQMDFSIFIDSHWETQLNTRIRRDIEQRGYSPRKAIATFLYSNLHEFEEYGVESKNWADVHIHCGSDYTLTLDAVCSKAAALIVDDESGTLARELSVSTSSAFTGKVK